MLLYLCPFLQNQTNQLDMSGLKLPVRVVVGRLVRATANGFLAVFHNSIVLWRVRVTPNAILQSVDL